MKKLIILTVFLLCGSIAFAGENEKKAKQVSANMEKALGLTKEQVNEIYNLTVKKMEYLAAYAGKTDEESRQKFAHGKRDYHTEVGKQLKPEQFNKWLEIRKEQLKLKKEGKEIKSPVINEELEYLNG